MNPNLRHLSMVVSAATATLLVACETISLEPASEATTIRIEPQDLFIQEGQTGTLRVVVLDQNDREMPSPPTWAPPQWNITGAGLKIGPDGSVEGLRGGFNNAIARVAGKSAAVSVKVQPDEVALRAVLYLNQAAQNQSAGVRTIAGRAGLLRAFVLGDEGSFYEPSVKAMLYLGDEEVYSVTMTPEGDYLPERVDEGRLDRSYNAVIPGEHIQEGLEIVLDMDVNDVIPLKAGSSKRWPATGRVAMNVIQLETMRLMVVPTLQSLFPGNTDGITWANRLTTTGNDTRLTRALRPISDFEITVHEIFTTDQDIRSGNGWSRWLAEIGLLRSVEDHKGYYYGTTDLPPGSAYGGLGWVARPWSVGGDWDDVMAHELGHNMSLYHAPCGGAGDPDPAFPYGEGDIGIWGYNVEGGRLMPPFDFKDDMSYCDPTWVSDFHFQRAIEFRQTEPFADAAPADRIPRLYVSGGVIRGGGIEFYPSYVIESGPLTPDGVGEYSLEGVTADGSILFSHRFTPHRNGNGGAGFTFALPFEATWTHELDRIKVDGPAGPAYLDHNSQAASAIVVNPESGQVTAITSDLARVSAADGAVIAISAGLPIFEDEIR
ncbi:MAG: hypothetical protein J4G12_05880 [Gemmatimonadetes bacterium]|nr:hypothetical protein [Gemmatimonadota bacterium]